MHRPVRTSRHAVRRPALTIAGILLVATLSSCASGDPGESGLRFALEHGDDKPTEFRVLTDRIGVVPDPDRTEEEILKALTGLGYEIVGYGESTLWTASLGEGATARTYLDLRREGWRLLEAARGLVAWAGPVVETLGADDPGSRKDRGRLIATDVLIVKFRAGVDDGARSSLVDALGVRRVRGNPVDDREVYFEIDRDREDLDVFTASEAFLREDVAEYATPNFYVWVDERQFVPNDRLFGNQWSLDNTGQGGGTVDADIDADFAWTIARGNANTVIAVLDGGFDIAHLDLAPNLFASAGEVAGNGVDDDGNAYVDDINGWDFTTCGGGVAAGCGDNNPTGPDSPAGRHGTMTSGAAVAAGNNNRGVTGSCPNCTWLPIRLPLGPATVAQQALAFAYAQAAGADIITNSWGYRLNGLATAPVVNAINNANAAGAAVFFAMFSTGGGFEHDCIAGGTTGVDISALANVIAVSASNNLDTRTPSGYGGCMDVLAPTDSSGTAGTLWPPSTDMTGAQGYNTANPIGGCPSPEFAPPPADDTSYTYCASGTSYATPLAAGISGLMESVDNTLTPLRHRRVLQDTADKIEPAVAAYGEDTGFSAPAAAPTPIFAVGGVGSTHGYGRVNAFEAVRLVAPTAIGGRGDVDAFLRDNELDWGNTEQPSNVRMDNPRGFVPHYRSVSIKIDAPPFEAVPPTTPAQFAAFPDEDPISETTNKVYLLLRNRGRNAATNVRVKLQWAFAGTALPPLPADFWTVFPADSALPSPWNVIDNRTVPSLGYSGASVALQPGDGATVLAFDFDAPALDTSVASFRHYCLFAVIDADNDPVLPVSRTRLAPDRITPFDNNVTHRNVSLQDPLDPGRTVNFAFFVRNPTRASIRTVLRVTQPKGWEAVLDDDVWLRGVELEPGAEEPVVLRVQGRGVGEVRVEQLVPAAVFGDDPLPVDAASGDGPSSLRPLGGVVYRFRDRERKESDESYAGGK